MKKLLSILLVSSCGMAFATIGDTPYTLTQQLGMVNGVKDFKKLPKEMQTLSQATVGLQMQYSDGTADNCTGVAISKSDILTAAHCFINEADGKVKQLKQLYLISNPMSISAKMISPKDITLKQTSNIALIQGDYIIMHSDKINKSHFISASVMLSSTADVANYLSDFSVNNQFNFYKSNQSMYSIGWGSNSKFEWAKTNLVPNSTDMYIDDKDIMYMVNTDIEAQEGDSGGPIFICNTTGSGCKLFGIITEGGKNNQFWLGISMCTKGGIYTNCHNKLLPK